MDIPYRLRTTRFGRYLPDRIERPHVVAAVAVLVIAASAVFLLTYSGSALLAGSPEPVYRWVCHEPGCGNEFRTEELPVAPAASATSVEELLTASSHTPPAACPKCGKSNTAQAYQCPHCERAYDRQVFRAGTAEQPAPCPHCGKPLTRAIE